MDRSVSAAIAAALMTADPRSKAMAARAVARDFRMGRLLLNFGTMMPNRPARPEKPELLLPRNMPQRGRGQSLSNRIAFLHALAHIELNAIDLALDIAGRFGDVHGAIFVSDWLKVASEEAMHFALLSRRLNALGSQYGALPAHDGLWQASEATAHDVLARLAIVPLVLEARGLDVSPATIARFDAAGDQRSAIIMTRIYEDEINHVATGMRWFSKICDSRALPRETHWQMLVRSHFKGSLKPPFNDSARETAGLTRNYYAMLASPTRDQH